MVELVIETTLQYMNDEWMTNRHSWGEVQQGEVQLGLEPQWFEPYYDRFSVVAMQCDTTTDLVHPS